MHTSPPPTGASEGPRGDTSAQASNSSPSSLTAAEIEERAENLAERREKLDYFYISAFTAILVFTFNNFNSRTGILAHAPVWLVEVGWGALIVAALCPLYAISVRFKGTAINLDRIAGESADDKDDEYKKLFKALRRRSEFAHRAMTLLFLFGVLALCAAYALGLKRIGR